MRSVKVKYEVVHLSPEHAKQYERFTGVPYDPVGSAHGRAWADFKHLEYLARVNQCSVAQAQTIQRKRKPKAE
jgi:hypothetical protein